MHALKFQGGNQSKDFLICFFNPALFDPADDATSDEYVRTMARSASRDIPRAAVVDGFEYPDNQRIQF